MAITTINAQKADYRAFPTELRTENNVFEVSGKNASELYQLTKSWIAREYTNPQRVIKLDDENKFIKINYHFDITSPSKVKVKYNLLFDFKDDNDELHLLILEILMVQNTANSLMNTEVLKSQNLCKNQ